MLLVIIAAIVVTSSAAIAIAGHRDGSLVGATTVHSFRATTPLDEAERILARRYARGEISAEEYDRMLAVLRR